MRKQGAPENLASLVGITGKDSFTCSLTLSLYIYISWLRALLIECRSSEVALDIPITVAEHEVFASDEVATHSLDLGKSTALYK